MAVVQKEKKCKPYLKFLITHLLNKEEDNEDFNECMEFALSNILYHHFMCVDKFKVNSCLNGLVEKFRYHGFFNRSNQLKQCKEKFLSLNVIQNHREYDIGWSILSLLSLLAENPTGCLSDSLVHEEIHLADTSLSISTLQSYDDSVDWYTYLREGDERFQISSFESMDEWSDEEEDQTVSRLSDSESTDLVTVVSKYENGVHKTSQTTVSIIQMPSLIPNTGNVLSDKFHGSNKQFFNKLMIKKYHSLEFLKSHRQNSWWNNTCLRELPQSDLRDANLALQWEKFSRYEEKLNIISDFKLLRELVWCVFVYSPGAVIFRPYFSLSSVRPDTLQKFLSVTLETLSLHREMTSFRTLLSNLTCSHTLWAYSCALAQVLRPLGERFVHIERILRCGERKMTLLDLSVDMEAKFRDVRYLYFNIHTNIIKAWDKTSHYMQAHTVLQVLFHQVQEASTSTRVSMCTSLLVQCLSVSFEMVDILLSEGRLNDPSNEFFLFSTMDNEIKSRITVQPSFPTNEFLRSYYEETESCANAFVLVDKLNKLVALESSIQNKGNLYHEFVQILTKKFSTADSNIEVKHTGPTGPVTFKVDTHDDVETTIASVLLGLIRARKTTVTCFIKQQLLDNYNLFHHLQVLSRVLLIDTEYPYLTVYKYILQSIESDLDWRNEFHLSQMLEECLDSEFPQFSSLFSINIVDESTKCLPHVLEFIDLITINFKVGLPINLVLTSDCMTQYNTIFRFILKIKWALSLVQGLQFEDIATRNSTVKQKLYLLRHSLLHLICSLQSHHMCLLLQIFSVDLQNDLLRVSSVDSLIQAHERHLRTALFHCLLLPKQSPLQQGLIKILCLSDNLKLLWTSESEGTTKNLEVLQLKYMKATWNFTELLHRSIPSSSHQIYNSIFDLWSSMVTSSPAHNVPEDLDEI